MTSVHAGLFGNDTLFLLDEVHLAVPFSETLAAVSRWRKSVEIILPDRWSVVHMSATPGTIEEGASVFSIDDEDLRNERLAKRINAHKHTKLVPIKTRGKDESQHRAQVAAQCVEQAELLMKAGAKTVGIVVNRVDTARLVRKLLSENEAKLDAALLTGRMRPLDRDRVFKKGLRDRIAVGRTRESNNRRLVVAATQCIEAGADFDFDGLVTECASLDALRQRFGRLDRIGELGETHAVIVARSDLVDGKNEDPIYGQALTETWRWLSEQGDAVDFGVAHLRLPTADRLSALVAPSKHAPLLLPTHLDTWVQTNPSPEPEPDVAHWLHGPELGRPEVQLVFRADLTVQDLEQADSDPTPLVERLTACPPSSLEALSLPLSAAQAWLRSDGVSAEIADVESAAIQESIDDESLSRRALWWAADNSRVITRADEIRPGSTLIVPSSYGGIQFDNWDPEGTTTVSDLGDIAQWFHRGRATVRLNPDVLNSWLGTAASESIAIEAKEAIVSATPIFSANDDGADPHEALADWLELARESIEEPWMKVFESTRAYRRVLVDSKWWVIVARRSRSIGENGDISTEDDAASFVGVEVRLDDHCDDVRRVAESFARSLGLSDGLTRDIGLAAWLHDIGKADKRFQQMLVGGSEVRLAALEKPLAKSASLGQDAAARREARKRAGYPDGYRHELLSVEMASRSGGALASASDPDLVLHLVGSHHGWCRPFAPLLADEKSIPVRLDHRGVILEATTGHELARIDSGVADRFWALVRRYGWWGLAWLETVLRLADHRASEWGAAERGA
jgi:CRISPR-associated endonuclease/helicase Cas3